MARNFPNFLDAYYSYAKDDFAPDIFHYWVGFSVLAGALERKVWSLIDGQIFIYPNLYIFLVAPPSSGKSTVGAKGKKILEALGENQIRILPTQGTSASFIEEMRKSEKVFTMPGGGIMKHSSAYWYASEASNAFEVVHGNIIPLFTDWYDCPYLWEKGLKLNGVETISNVCFNMLACATPSFLAELIPKKHIMGGFASRNIYIHHDSVIERKPKWNSGRKSDQVMFERLVEDLKQINSLSGQFKTTPEFIAAWELWSMEFHSKIQKMESDKVQAFHARTGTNALKLAMILSVSESNSLVLEERHWKQAVVLSEGLTKFLSKVIQMSAGEDAIVQNGTALAVRILNESKGHCEYWDLRRKMMMRGVNTRSMEEVLASMQKHKMIELNMDRGISGHYKLLIDAGQYL